MPILQVRKLDPRAPLPSYQTADAAGMDLAAFTPDAEVSIAPGRIALIRTGISIAVPRGHEAQVRPRSGLASKHGITLPNSPGTIDADYRGEVLVPLINLGRESFVVTHGLRIAQMVVAPVVHVEVEEVTELGSTARGEGGFGSTGM